MNVLYIRSCISFRVLAHPIYFLICSDGLDTSLTVQMRQDKNHTLWSRRRCLRDSKEDEPAQKR